MSIYSKHSSFYKQIKKLSQYGIGQFVNLIVPFIISPYLILTCGEANFGKSAIGMTIAFFVIVFVDFGSDILGVKQISQNRNHISKLNHVFSKIIYGKIIFALLFSIIFYTVIACIDIDENEKLLYYLSGTVFISQIVNPFWIFQGLEDFKNFSILTIISKILYLFFCLLLIKDKSDYVFINLSFGLSVFITGVFSYLILNKKHKIQFIKIERKEILSYFNINKTFTFSQIFTWIQMYAPILIISFLGNNKLVGQFRIIDQIISVFKTYIMMSFNFIYPKVCYEISLTFDKAIKNWSRFNLVNTVFVVVLLGLIFIFKEEIMIYYNILEVKKMSNLLGISLLYPIFFLFVNIVKQLYLALHYEKLFSIITIAMSILNLLGICLAFTKLQLYGVYYSCIFVEMLTLLLLIVFNFKYNIVRLKKY